jgi:outer membrane protein assembly factor BamD
MNKTQKHIRILLILIATLIIAGCAPTATLDLYKNKTARQIFTSGEHAMAKGDYEQAVQDFEALDTLYPFGPFAEQGQLDIIFAYYKNNDPASALGAADRYIRLYPRSPNVDYAYYMKALINYGRGETWFQHVFPTDPAQRDLGYMEQSFRDFNELSRRFPDSPYAQDARMRMAYIRNLLAQHELNIAQYYMRHKAYVAAANRAGGIVENYQGAPQVIPALGIMVEAYRALGETRLANNVLQVLELNFPNAAITKKLSGRPMNVNIPSPTYQKTHS